MAHNLFYLGIYFNNCYYDTIARQMTQSIIPLIDYPSAYSNWLNVLLNFSEQNKELAVCGEKALYFGEKINQNYWPNLILAGTTVDTMLPFLENRYCENQTLFYLCQNKTCALPITEFAAIERAVNLAN